MKPTPKRGGKRAGAGRPRIAEDARSVTTSISLTPSQRDKLARLGGSPWVRDRIDKARESKSG